MQDYHRPLHQKMRQMEFQVRNAIDQPHSREAYDLMKNIKAVQTGLERGEHARTLEARMHSIDMQLHTAELKRTGLMSSQDTNRFRKTFQDTIHHEVRRLPHY